MENNQLKKYIEANKIQTCEYWKLRAKTNKNQKYITFEVNWNLRDIEMHHITVNYQSKIIITS